MKKIKLESPDTFADVRIETGSFTVRQENPYRDGAQVVSLTVDDLFEMLRAAGAIPRPNNEWISQALNEGDGTYIP